MVKMNKIHSEDGFTLVELIIAVFMVGLFSMAMVGLVRFYQNSYTQNRNVSDELQNANMAMQMLIRDLRGGTGITLSGSTVSFKDINGTAVTYQLNGTDLKRTSGGTTSLLAQNVATLNFAFDPTNTNTVMITMSIKITSNGVSTQVELHDSVRARNLGKSVF